MDDIQFGAGGSTPPGSDAAGGVPAPIPGTSSPRHSPEGLERIRALARERLQRPGVIAQMHAAREAKRGWSEETKAQVRAWAAEGVEVQEMARRLGVRRQGLHARAALYGIDIRGGVLSRYDAGAEVLRRHYATTMGYHEVRALYSAARGAEMSEKAMRLHAKKLGLKRAQGASRAAQFAAERVPMIEATQRMLNEHAPLAAIMAALGMSDTRLRSMLRHGEVVRPPPPPKVPTPKRVRVRKSRAKPKDQHLPKGGNRSKLPASWVRAPASPPKPKPVYETVEAWLAAGNAITRCPAAMVVQCQADIPEADKAALAALYAERERTRAKGPKGATLRAVLRQRGVNHGWFV